MSGVRVEPKEVAFARIEGGFEIHWDKRSMDYRDPVVVEFGGDMKDISIQVHDDHLVYTVNFVGHDGKKCTIQVTEEM